MKSLRLQVNRIFKIATVLHAVVFSAAFPGSVNAQSQPPQAQSSQVQSPDLIRRLTQISELNKRNDYDRATPLADETVAKYPQSYEAHVWLGVCCHYMEEDEKAIAEFKWALARKPKDWNVLQYLALTYFRMEKNDLALKYINDSIAATKINAEKAASYTNKRDILKHMKRNLEAEEAADMAVKLFPAPHWILERMKLRLINGHWQGTIDDGNVVLARMPKFREKVLGARAKSYIGLKKFPEAERLLKQLIKEYSETRDHHLDLIRLYELTGKNDLALKEKAELKKLDESFK